MFRGRFAPSPTGPLHFGSLITAVASFLEAKNQGGDWLVRMEDLDTPRIQPGVADLILYTLDAFGFAWQGEVIYQSHRTDLYEAAMQHLDIYPCSCSRREIADSAVHRIDGYIYPKTCLFHVPKTNMSTAWRVKTSDFNVQFIDAIQGNICQNVSRDIGDFVIKRADGIFAYQLAVVVDDFAQSISHIVRGADLLDSTPRQIFLQKKLGYPTPRYAHVPIATNVAREKLSKQTLAEPLSVANANQQLFRALLFLGQNPPVELRNSPLSDVWQWAFKHWSLKKIASQRAIIFNQLK